MARGRRPKPTAVKRLEGNPGKRGLNALEPRPKKGAPACPDWLEDDAKAEWERLLPQVESLGLLTGIDMAAFAAYCQSFARWKEAEEFISQHGSMYKTKSGVYMQVPQVGIAHSNLRIMMRIATEFGFTPSSRSRIIADQSQGEIVDEMEDLLSGGA